MTDQSWYLSGACLEIRYLRYRNGFPARDYIESMPGRDQARLMVIARQFVAEGLIRNGKHFHWLHGDYRDLGELKPGGHRIVCFRHASTIYLTNGGPKGNKKDQQRLYDLGLKMRNDFFKRLAGG